MWMKALARAARARADRRLRGPPRHHPHRHDRRRSPTRYDALIADGLVPARRWGEAEDVGAAVVALAHPAASPSPRAGHQRRRRARRCRASVKAPAIGDVASMYDYIIVGGGTGGLRARQPAVRGSGVKRAAARGRAARTGIRCIHMPAGFAKMTKGIASWGWSTVPQKHIGGPRASVHAGQGDRRRLLDQRPDLHARQRRSTTTRWASEDGCAGLELSRRAALFQARRGQPALRRRLSRHRRAARRLHADLHRCRSARPSSAPRRSSASRTIPISTAPAQEGVGYYQLTQRERAAAPPPPSPISKPIRDRPNLTVRTGALVDPGRRREGPRRRRRARRQRRAPAARPLRARSHRHRPAPSARRSS